MNGEIPEFVEFPAYRKYIGGRNSGSNIGLYPGEVVLIKRGLLEAESDYWEVFLVKATPLILMEEPMTLPNINWN